MNPISYLQEYCQKNNHSMPMYDVTDHKILPNTNSFTIKVTVGSLKAEGTAPNKKGAKVKAAENMISLMNSKKDLNFTTASNSNSPYCSPEKIDFGHGVNRPNTSLSSDSLNNSLLMADGNYVGKLQEFCVQRKLKTPIYDWDLSYIGGGHKLICKLENLSEEAVGPNKKIAKQACAEKMWHRLMEVEENSKGIKQESNRTNKNIDSLCFSLDTLKIENTFDLQLSIDKAKLVCSRQQTGMSSEPKEIFIEDYHSHLKNTLPFDSLQKVSDYLNRFTFNFSQGLKLLENNLKEICSLLGVDYTETSLQSDVRNTFFVACTINTFPTLTAIGDGDSYEVAKISAIIYSINIIRDILQ
ncbi:RISC-loading complex subunit tarbp2-like [Chelonus insularis]|uniref:RISC-loading complex subunit tarbp2-like n=1 Tax=Chelonus insularis TaxID=460826 RepID=UPI0015898F59|nr:RISC-loading complex subunit tarbp2-like [Chelonus insularis]XP_034938846.1 RISC-loading complex subunit tarbp2-like [Chelonus insularis]XP_034938847.1 RISC-loading complex subunit tarbp2-like [Chelonus insularis]